MEIVQSSPIFLRQGNGGDFQSDKLAEDCTGKIKNTVASVLEGKYPYEKIPSCAMLEMYEKTPILSPSISRRNQLNW